MQTPFDKPPQQLTQPEESEEAYWEKHGFNFGSWDERKIWNIELPIVEMSVSEFTWHLDIPYWDSDDSRKLSISPRDVINKKFGSSKHQIKVGNADLNYPIDIMFHEGKWFILDGVHRLVRALQEDQENISVRVFPKERLEEIRY